LGFGLPLCASDQYILALSAQRSGRFELTGVAAKRRVESLSRGEHQMKGEKARSPLKTISFSLFRRAASCRFTR